MGKGRVTTLISFVVATLLAVLAPPVGADTSPSPGTTALPPGLGIRLLDAPTDRRDDPRARVYIVDHVQPGASLSRRVEVTNGTTRAISVALYPAAAEVSEGSFTVLPGAAENQLTDWMRVTPGRVDLAPGASAVAEVEIDVPTGAGGGERYAAVMAETAEAPDASGISVASRVGIRVYLSVGGPQEPTSDFRITSLQAARQPDGLPAVTAQVRNTGQRALDMSGSLTLTDGPGGLSAGPFPAELGTTLAPGASSQVDVVLDRAITGGPWLARLTLQSGRVERAAEASITFPDDAGEAAEPVAAEDVPLAEDPDVVIPVAAGLLALAALLLLLVLRRRRNRDADQQEELLPAGQVASSD